MKISKLNKKGFSLIEVLISVAIFSVIVGGILLFSVRTIEAHTKTQAMQNALENARFTIEKLNKKVRTSKDINGDDGVVNVLTKSKEIFFIDNVDATKQCFKFENDKLLFDSVDADSEAIDCSHGDFSGFETLIGSTDGKIKVDGNFILRQTDTGTFNDRGFVRTVVTIRYNDASTLVTEKEQITIQSGVALRDY